MCPASACRCAATGVRVYRLWRDDGYLRDMMGLLTQLQVGPICSMPSRLAKCDSCHTVQAGPPPAADAASAVGQLFSCFASGRHIGEEATVWLCL